MIIFSGLVKLTLWKRDKQLLEMKITGGNVEVRTEGGYCLSSIVITVEDARQLSRELIRMAAQADKRRKLDASR